MIVYEGTKTEFQRSVDLDTIAEEIASNILRKLGRHTPDSEFRSWINSLHYMYKVLNDKEIPDDSGIAVEYNIPQTAKRVDFMISGYDEQGRPGMVIIELKQWSELKKVVSTEALVETFTGGANRKVVHPSYQAWSYARLIADYNASVQDACVMLIPCAYLHNYMRRDHDPLDDEQYSDYTSEAPAFSMGQVLELREYIKKFVRKGERSSILSIMVRYVLRRACRTVSSQ